MLSKLAILCLSLYASICIAAVEVNSATASQLIAIKGIGPVMTENILEARKINNFKNWEDLTLRVKGLGPKSAAKLSTKGLTVNGKIFPQGSLDIPVKGAKP